MGANGVPGVQKTPACRQPGTCSVLPSGSGPTAGFECRIIPLRCAGSYINVYEEDKAIPPGGKRTPVFGRLGFPVLALGQPKGALQFVLETEAANDSRAACCAVQECRTDAEVAVCSPCPRRSHCIKVPVIGYICARLPVKI